MRALVGEVPVARCASHALCALGAAALLACGSSSAPRSSFAPLPRAAYAHYLAGRAAIYDEEPAAAVPHLRAALAAAPDEPQLAIALVDALREAEDPAAAHTEARRALARWPRHSEVWRATGELLAAEGSYPAALRAYRRAVALDAGDEAAHLGLIATLQRSDVDDRGTTRVEMLAAVRALLVRLPDSSDGHYILGQLLAERDESSHPGSRDAAIAALQTTLRLAPDNLDARSLLAAQLRAAGRMADAVAEARSAFDRSGEDLELAAPLLELLCAAGDRRAALDLVGLYDDSERAAAALVTAARWALELEELPLAQGLVERALQRARADRDDLPEDEDARAQLAAAHHLALRLLVTRLHAPFLAPAPPAGAAFTPRRCAATALAR